MKQIIFSILILTASCKPDEPIRKPISTPPELRDTIIHWEKIMDNEPVLIYCYN
jgi:hypothetical protein